MDTSPVPPQHQKEWNTWYEKDLLSSAVQKVKKEFEFFRVEVPTDAKDLSFWLGQLKHTTESSLYTAIVSPMLDRLHQEIEIINNFNQVA